MSVSTCLMVFTHELTFMYIHNSTEENEKVVNLKDGNQFQVYLYSINQFLIFGSWKAINLSTLNFYEWFIKMILTK